MSLGAGGEAVGELIGDWGTSPQPHSWGPLEAKASSLPWAFRRCFCPASQAWQLAIVCCFMWHFLPLRWQCLHELMAREW